VKDSTKTSLDALLKADREKRDLRTIEQAEKRRLENQFLAAFYVQQETVIKPAMEEMGKYLERSGYAYRIEERKDVTQTDGRHQPAAISIRFFEDQNSSRPFSQTNDGPAFTVMCDWRDRKVRFHESRMHFGGGGQAGPAGDAPLDQVNADFVQGRITAVLNDVMK